MQTNALSILNANCERPLSAGQSGTASASARSWPGAAVPLRIAGDQAAMSLIDPVLPVTSDRSRVVQLAKLRNAATPVN